VADASDRAFDAYLAFEPIETPARARDPGVVSSMEKLFADFKASVRGNDIRGAERARDAIEATMPKVVGLRQGTGTAYDACIQSFLIILREGFEAILVIGAVVAFLLKTGHRERLRDIWTGVALGLGSMAAFAIHRFRFFGRESISFLLLLPIALPGIITGMALNSYFAFWKFNFSLWTIVIGHATFCVVVVYNNVIARLRRVPGSLTEASMDLGADGFETFRYVTFPTISTALISGGLLAFALSFDEVIVTTFTAGAQNTLPIWIFGQIRLGQQLPQVNVVVFLILAVTIIPVALAQRLTRESGILRTE